jgi:6-pyruvoyltetrahydropterin/6-carboxytetrahydropterin synthase
MPSRTTLKIVTDFAAAHTLRDYPGSCSRMHGHNWKVEVEVMATTLDAAGMVLDFKLIRRATNEVIDRYDHQYLNEVAPFDTLNPTAENIAATIYKAVAERLNDGRVKVCATTIWETDRASARYTED